MSVVAVDVVVGLAALLSAATGAPPLARRRAVARSIVTYPHVCRKSMAASNSLTASWRDSFMITAPSPTDNNVNRYYTSQRHCNIGFLTDKHTHTHV